jgi:uncharacterized protein
VDIDSTIIDKINSFVEYLEKDNIQIQQIYLFGSQAKGKFNEYSDIDLALVSQNFCGVRFKDNETIIKKTPSIFSMIETHPYRPEDFTTDNPFVEEILRTGIKLK